MRKGTVAIVIAERPEAWRRVTHQERQDWYNTPGNGGMGDDGETILAPQDHYYPDVATLDMVTVTKGKVAARQGYHTIPNCVQVSNGTDTFYIRLSEIEAVIL